MVFQIKINKSISNFIKLFIGISSSCFFLWLFINRINIGELFSLASDVKPLWIIASLLIYFAEYFLRISRWKTMLNSYNMNITWMNCASPLLLSYGVNALLPFRAGDALRCFSHSSRLGVTSSALMVSILIERLLDLFVVVNATLFSLLITNFNAPGYIVRSTSLFFFISCLIVTFFVLVGPFDSSRKLTSIILVRFDRFAISDYIARISEHFRTLVSFRLMIKVFSFTLLIWVLEATLFLFLALSLPSLNQPLSALLAFPLGTLSTLIPSSPGYIGTFDFFVAEMMHWYGNDIFSSSAYAVIVHFIILAPMVIIGIFFMLSEINKLSIKQRFLQH
jgi:glycosyltransferase 2 family protein